MWQAFFTLLSGPPVSGLQPARNTINLITQGAALGFVFSGFQPDVCINDRHV